MLNVKKLLTKILNELNADKYISESKTSSSISITPNGRGTVSIDVSKSGYTPIGIVGIFVPDTDVFVVNEFFLASATTVTVILTNLYSASRASAVRVNVLYRKLGGVLRSSIFKAFSDFVSLLKGGDINAECKEITNTDTNNSLINGYKNRRHSADHSSGEQLKNCGEQINSTKGNVASDIRVSVKYRLESSVPEHDIQCDWWRLCSGTRRKFVIGNSASQSLLGCSRDRLDSFHCNAISQRREHNYGEYKRIYRSSNRLTLGRGWAVC